MANLLSLVQLHEAEQSTDLCSVMHLFQTFNSWEIKHCPPYFFGKFQWVEVGINLKYYCNVGIN